jgi:alkylhydroperoxidase family enzyme
VGRKAGITEDQLHNMAAFEQSPHFNNAEKLALRLAVALTQTPADVGDELFSALRAQFSEPQLVEIAGAVAWENNRARFNRTFAIEAEGFSKGQFCPLPERLHHGS